MCLTLDVYLCSSDNLVSHEPAQKERLKTAITISGLMNIMFVHRLRRHT